jgi:hypothetical protein
MNAVLKFPVPAAAAAQVNPVDQLGFLQSQIADLQAIEKALKEEIKTSVCDRLGVGASTKVEGDLFKATIIETAPVFGVDAKAVEKKLRELLGAEADAFFAANTKQTRAGAITIKLTAREVAA